MARLSIGADEKKKLLILGGLLAAIIVVIVVLYVLPGGSSPPPTVVAEAGKDAAAGETAGKDDAAKGGPPAPGAGGPPAPGGGAPPAAAAPAAGGGGGGLSAASFIAVSDFREDPFAPFALPVPEATPEPPTPPPPINIAPPAVALGGPESIRPFDIPGPPFSTPPSRVLVDLAPPTIPIVVRAPTAPTIVVPSGDQGGGSSRAPGKRLSGVVIGDSVRALLVIESGNSDVPEITRIVQPGDEVDGIRILRIERTNEGGRPVTRMFIRENGEERFVDLRPAPQQTGGAGGAAGAGAGAGPPGGVPGRGGRPALP